MAARSTRLPSTSGASTVTTASHSRVRWRPWIPLSSQAGLVFDGIKQRVRYRIMDAGVAPIDVSLYAELAELHDEIELEVKINVQKRLGPVRLMANFSGLGSANRPTMRSIASRPPATRSATYR